MPSFVCFFLQRVSPYCKTNKQLDGTPWASFSWRHELYVLYCVALGRIQREVKQ